MMTQSGLWKKSAITQVQAGSLASTSISDSEQCLNVEQIESWDQCWCLLSKSVDKSKRACPLYVAIRRPTRSCFDTLGDPDVLSQRQHHLFDGCGQS